MTIRPPLPFAPPRSRPASSAFEVIVGERPLLVAVRRNARARRYTLRLKAKGDGATVTIPRRGTLAEARAFVGRHVGWLAARLADRPAAVEAADGAPRQLPAEIPLRGRPATIVAIGGLRGATTCREGDRGPELHVAGAPEHLHRRLVDFLKKEAQAELMTTVARHAARLGVRPAAIRVKDTTSRWGSASSRGVLAFSWRLILAPPFVLDYVAAHEVAHLREMNHSDRFWTLCRELAPQTDMAKAWLKANGAALHRAI